MPFFRDDVDQHAVGAVLPRKAELLVREALTDTRVVVVNGARQCGKSTLVRLVAAESGEWRSLDNDSVRAAARHDPHGFVAEPGLMIVDEIQRAPELLLAIKERVDRDTRAGQFLLTGSARVLGLRPLPDVLPGRTETVELWPLSQGEIDGQPDGFIDAVFGRSAWSGADASRISPLDRGDYAQRVVRGGFPEAVARTDPRRRSRFLDSYVGDLIARDVAQLSEIERAEEMRRLMSLLAARSGQLLVEANLATDSRLSARTVGRYVDLLEEVFLIKRVPAWSRNLSQRSVGTPKVCIVDSGVAANLLDVDAAGLSRPDSPSGHLLDSFVVMELARQLTWSRTRARLYHYRTRDGVEVDAVLEDRRGRVVAIEVRSASTVRADDFRGLRHLAQRLGDDLIMGVVLYTGERSLSFGERLHAVPISAIWTTDATENPGA